MCVENNGRESVLAAAIAIGDIAGCKDVAKPRGLVLSLFVRDRQRLQESAVCEVDAAICRSEGMYAVGRDCEAEFRQPRTRSAQVRDRKHHMIDTARGCRKAHGRGLARNPARVQGDRMGRLTAMLSA